MIEEDEASRLPHSRLDTRGLSAKAAMDVWQENIGVMFDARLARANEDFHASVEAFLMGDMVLGRVNVPAQNFDRSRARIGRDGLDHVMLQFYEEGSCGNRHGNEEGTIPGDLWVCDLSHPQMTSVSSVESLNLVVPRRLLDPLLAQPQTCATRLVSAKSPMVGLLHQHLRALEASAPKLTVTEGAALVAPTLHLAAAVLNGQPAEETAGGIAVSLTSAIIRHIEDNLLSPDLAPGRVAAVFGISPRKLFYLFEPHGGFTAHVQARRLERCRAALLNPALGDKSIAEIAESFGFANPKSFSRAFRRAFQMTAREVRNYAEGRSAPSQTRELDEWWQWIGGLR